jgi:hypothetical protein
MRNQEKATSGVSETWQAGRAVASRLPRARLATVTTKQWRRLQACARVANLPGWQNRLWQAPATQPAAGWRTISSWKLAPLPATPIFILFISVLVT